MKLTSIVSTALLSITLLFQACGTRSSHTQESESADIAVGEQMHQPDDFDSTALEEKPEPEELPDRYVAHSSNEAIELMQSLPDADKYMSGILPKMSNECLDYAMRLLNNTHDGFLIVDKESMQVGLYDRYGREVLRYGVACARNYGTKHKKGDSRTPEGFFSVEGIYDSTDWLFRDDNGKVSKVKGQFGPRFIRLSIPGTSQIGIHGTRAPGSIGRRCSHGCIRVTNDNILELVKHVKPGMPVIVSPGRRDEKVNLNEGYKIPWVSIGSSASRRKPQTPDPIAPPVTPAETDTLPVDTASQIPAPTPSPEMETQEGESPATTAGSEETPASPAE